MACCVLMSYLAIVTRKVCFLNISTVFGENSTRLGERDSQPSHRSQRLSSPKFTGSGRDRPPSSLSSVFLLSIFFPFFFSFFSFSSCSSHASLHSLTRLHKENKLSRFQHVEHVRVAILSLPCVLHARGFSSRPLIVVKFAVELPKNRVASVFAEDEIEEVSEISQKRARKEMEGHRRGPFNFTGTADR